MSPNEVCCLWFYLKDDVLTLDQFRSRVELDRALRVTTGVSVWWRFHRLVLDRIDYRGGGGGETERERERERERETDRQTDRQAGRQTGRQTDRQTDRGRDREKEKQNNNILH